MPTDPERQVPREDPAAVPGAHVEDRAGARPPPTRP